MHFALHIQRERAAVGVVQRVLRFAVCLVGQLRIACHRQFVGVAHVHVRRNQRIAVHVHIGRAQHIVIHHNRSRRGFPFAAVRAACVVGATQVKRVFARAQINGAAVHADVFVGNCQAVVAVAKVHVAVDNAAA